MDSPPAPTLSTHLPTPPPPDPPDTNTLNIHHSSSNLIQPTEKEPED